jgi:myo-inositol 2-dehydrogenase / D-chiro-inositol 1-dehydrogenase
LNDVTEERVVRVGLIGCGGNARGHMRSLGSVAGAHIVSACDVVPAAAEAAAEHTGAEAYTDYRRMLDQNNLDAVYVSIPASAHGEPELAVLERSLPIFVEKPVAINLATARTIEAAIAMAGVISCVGYQLRYRGSADAARAALGAADAGKAGIAHGSYWCGTGRAGGETWRMRMADSGGQILEQATHTLDMMRFLLGEVEEVFAYFSRAILSEGHGDAPDVHAVTLRFTSGAVGTMSATWALDPKNWSLANVVQIGYGESRLLWRVDGLSVTHDMQTEEVAPAPDGNIDQIFVDAVRRGDSSAIRSDYAEGVRTLALCLAINESARRGAPVRVAEFAARG